MNVITKRQKEFWNVGIKIFADLKKQLEEFGFDNLQLNRSAGILDFYFTGVLVEAKLEGFKILEELKGAFFHGAGRFRIADNVFFYDLQTGIDREISNYYREEGRFESGMGITIEGLATMILEGIAERQADK